MFKSQKVKDFSLITDDRFLSRTTKSRGFMGISFYHSSKHFKNITTGKNLSFE